MLALYLALGLCAGVLTTLAGMGGGLFLVAVIGVLRGPHEALAITAPALMLSNLHRTLMFRREIDRRVAGLIALGAIPGALLGGLVLPAIPAAIVSVLLVLTTVAALLRARGLLKLEPGRRSLVVAGSGIGALAATSGGAGLLVAPLVMSTGLRGLAYVSTVSCTAVALHVGRIAGYGAVGLLSVALLPFMVLLLGGLLGGNLLASRLRRYLRPEHEPRIELGALVLTTALALLGLAH